MVEVFECIQTVTEMFISAKWNLADVLEGIQTLSDVFISAKWRLANVFECIQSLVEVFKELMKVSRCVWICSNSSLGTYNY